MSSKKLTKTEVDRCVKELQRAIAEQDEHMDRYKTCSDAHRAEKLLLDTKEHLGKVIRLRHQVKAWLEGKEVREEPIRDKKDLLMQLKEQAEDRMEDFDREAKSRSKRAHHHTAGVEKEELTEEEQANLENQAWVRDMLQKVRDRKEGFEGELELASKKKPSAGKKKSDGGEDKGAVLQKKIQACNFHVFHLELMLRGLDNHVIDPYDVESVRYDLEQFLEDGELDENVYDPLDLPARLGVLAEEVSFMTKQPTEGSTPANVSSNTTTTKKTSTTAPPPVLSSSKNHEEKIDNNSTPKKDKKVITTPTVSPTMSTPTPIDQTTKKPPTVSPSAVAAEQQNGVLGGPDVAFQQYLELQRQREEELRKASTAPTVANPPGLNKPVLDLDFDESKLQSLIFNRGVADRSLEQEIAKQQEEFERLQLQHLQKQQQHQPLLSPSSANQQQQVKRNSPPGTDLRVSQPFFPHSTPPRLASSQHQQQQQQQGWGQHQHQGRFAQQPPQPTTVSELPRPFNPSQPPGMVNRQQQMAFEQQRIQHQLVMLEQRHQQQQHQQQMFTPSQQHQQQSSLPSALPQSSSIPQHQQFQQMMDQQRRYQMMMDQQNQYQFMQEQQQKQHQQQLLMVKEQQQRQQQQQSASGKQSLFFHSSALDQQDKPRMALPQLNEPLISSVTSPASAVPPSSSKTTTPPGSAARQKDQSSFLSLFSQDQPPSPFVQQQLLKFAKLAPPPGVPAASPQASASPSPSSSPPPDAYQQQNAGGPLSEDEQLLISLDATALLESLNLDPVLTDALIKSAIESGARSDIAEASLGTLAINLHRNGIPVDGRQKLIKALSLRKGGPK